MRISKSQTEKNRRLVIKTAVDLMTSQGFEGTTMKQIARAAELGDATIYKYFPSKEKLVLAYFEQAVADALAQIGKTKGLDSFSLQERMQLLIDALLERFLADREFVALAHKLVAGAPLAVMGDDLPGKTLLKQAFAEMLAQAESKAEIAPCSFKPSLAALLADGVYAITAYWLRDDSDEFANTTQMVDLSLGLLVLALHSGIVNKALDLGGFLLRSQLTRLLRDGNGLLDVLKFARMSLSGAGK
ncbi:TetR/AcrR family transcriptional regulator [Paucibacter sp. B2R-40]|uniref:TetR/AcrR family transcriptional regulator n=1 Tax=Paucibacter sp. B2R-40 TaxID=2893554 RepID=UPI0021E4B9BE|nr:TetR/AcrR family transcriptional regulator [Paucibacter sp. B2R-40]MCV2353745.1 TetR/AcrR family transcriptional regulator [Paucibacter sp. B2R-40]